jgi:hypothetical protein
MRVEMIGMEASASVYLWARVKGTKRRFLGNVELDPRSMEFASGPCPTSR